MSTSAEGSRRILQQMMSEHGLTPDTLLFREALRSALTPGDTAGTFRLAANDGPGESVIDVYGGGYVVQAAETGAGLAFAQSDQPDWQETMEMRVVRAGRATRQHLAADRVEVSVRLGDILDQGGLLYPVESVTVERAWYCTLPSGAVTVREVL